MRVLYIVILVLLFVSFSYFSITGYITVTREQAFVSRVVDGDTLELDTGEKVRLLGVNAPEKEEAGYMEATSGLKKAVEGKNVTMEKDVEDVDRYGRLLRYVYLNDLSVNLGMIQSGLAHSYFVEPDTRYQELFKESEEEAIESQKGIWKKSEIDCISIDEFNWDEGPDKNPDKEWVVFRNDCGEDLNLDGWHVKDEATHIYEFNDVGLESENTVKLVTGTGVDSARTLYWNQETPVWNNDGDRLFLRDEEGRLVLLAESG